MQFPAFLGFWSEETLLSCYQRRLERNWDKKEQSKTKIEHQEYKKIIFCW